MPVPSKVLQRHLVFNRNSAERWGAYAGHRAALARLIAEVPATPGARLLVLGAGNCNDLDLAALTARFAEVHLVDLDHEALRAGVERQGQVPREALVLHAPIDATGFFTELPALAKKPSGAVATSQAAIAAAQRALAALPGPFDVVVSACLLSQLMHSCRLVFGLEHPALAEVANALVLAHLRALFALTAPGGSFLLVTDTAASTTYPLVELWDAQPPRALLEELERSENLLSGTAPTYLKRLVVADQVLKAGLAGPARISEPWLWDLGDDVTLLVYALCARRAAG